MFNYGKAEKVMRMEKSIVENRNFHSNWTDIDTQIRAQTIKWNLIIATTLECSLNEIKHVDKNRQLKIFMNCLKVW